METGRGHGVGAKCLYAFVYLFAWAGASVLKLHGIGRGGAREVSVAVLEPVRSPLRCGSHQLTAMLLKPSLAVKDVSKEGRRADGGHRSEQK